MQHTLARNHPGGRGETAAFPPGPPMVSQWKPRRFAAREVPRGTSLPSP